MIDEKAIQQKPRKQFSKDDEGFGIVEIILILVIVIALVVIFRGKITKIVDDAFNSINNGSNEIVSEIHIGDKE